MTTVVTRHATPADAEAIARIFNQGIRERMATFETREQPPERFAAAIERGDLILAAEREGEVVAAAWIGPYTDRHEYYAGVGEATMYVERGARRMGVGHHLIRDLARAAEERGYYKLVGKLFASNEASRAMLRSAGWREVGIHLRHSKLEGEWKDVVVVERLFDENLRPRPRGA